MYYNLFIDTIILLIVVLFCFGLTIYEIRSFRKWMETRWYNDLKGKEDDDAA